jgi:hypothetical protein
MHGGLPLISTPGIAVGEKEKVMKVYVAVNLDLWHVGSGQWRRSAEGQSVICFSAGCHRYYWEAENVTHHSQTPSVPLV